MFDWFARHFCVIDAIHVGIDVYKFQNPPIVYITDIRVSLFVHFSVCAPPPFAMIEFDSNLEIAMMITHPLFASFIFFFVYANLPVLMLLLTKLDSLKRDIVYMNTEQITYLNENKCKKKCL